nr:MAG TPA: hypothetical protein [Caudoviricetes sp.]
MPGPQAASVCLGSYKFRNSCPTLSPNLYLEITILKAETHAGTKAHLPNFSSILHLALDNLRVVR